MIFAMTDALLVAVVLAVPLACYFGFKQLVKARRQKRTSALKQLAGELNLNFTDRKSRIPGGKLCQFLAHMPDRGSIEVHNVMSGTLDGIPVWVGDYQFRSGLSVKGTQTLERKTIIATRSNDFDLPIFMCSPGGFSLSRMGTRDTVGEKIELPDYPEFSKRMNLSSDDRREVTRLFQPNVIDFYVRHPKHYTIGCQQEVIVLQGPTTLIPTGQIAQMLHQAVTLFQELARACSEIEDKKAKKKAAKKAAKKPRDYESLRKMPQDMAYGYIEDVLGQLSQVVGGKIIRKRKKSEVHLSGKISNRPFRIIVGDHGSFHLEGKIQSKRETLQLGYDPEATPNDDIDQNWDDSDEDVVKSIATHVFIVGDGEDIDNQMQILQSIPGLGERAGKLMPAHNISAIDVNDDEIRMDFDANLFHVDLREIIPPCLRFIADFAPSFETKG